MNENDQITNRRSESGAVNDTIDQLDDLLRALQEAADVAAGIDLTPHTAAIEALRRMQERWDDQMVTIYGWATNLKSLEDAQ